MSASPGDIIEATVIHDNNQSGEQVNRYQFELDSVGLVTDADLLDDIAEVIHALYNVAKVFISLRNVLREVKVFNVTQDLLVGSTDALTYVGGTAADPTEPQGICLYAYFPTAVPRVILSKYLPSPSTGQVDTNGSVKATTLAILVTYATMLLSPIDGGANQYVYGYLSPKTLSFVKPTIAVASGIFAYQRRRKPGRGS